MKSKLNVTYNWKVKPIIRTYTNPCKIDSDIELKGMLYRYPHFCASDTLMQGMIKKYHRNSFRIIGSIEHLSDRLFDNYFTDSSVNLQMYLEVVSLIDNMPEESPRCPKCKKTFYDNRSEIVAAFRKLILMDYQYDVTKCDEMLESQQLFFEYIYEKLSGKYKTEIKNLKDSINKEKYEASIKQVLLREINHEFFEDNYKKENNDILNALDKLCEEDINSNEYKNPQIYKDIADNLHNLDLSKVVFHGINRFTPEIMQLIEAIDNLGIQIVFMFNYAKNLPSLYGIWDDAYKWTGVEIEDAKNLDLLSGRQTGRNIANICEGKRQIESSIDQFIKYDNITEFTDGNVRKEFEYGEKKAKSQEKNNPLGFMKVQYYAASEDKPNDLLRNYFPNQFLDKPFMAYPIGQFIHGLFEMWNFEDMCIEIDFSALKECSTIKIAHKNESMHLLLEKTELYFTNVKSKADFIERAEKLKKGLSFKEEGTSIPLTYLSYYTIRKEDVDNLIGYIEELDRLGQQIFGKDKLKKVTYSKVFKVLLEEIDNRDTNSDYISEKEQELVLNILKSLDNDSSKVSGSVKELKEALYFYMSTKRETSSADWIVRGFDQLDGAPLLAMKLNQSYEFGMLSMNNMNGSNYNVLPWPLDEKIFEEYSKQNTVYLGQLEAIARNKAKYMQFYLFYGAFFSRVNLRFSYVANEDGQTQRPYYLLELLRLNSQPDKNKYSDVSYEVDNKEKSNIAKVPNTISKSEQDIFSVCPYKYFMSSVLRKPISYKSNYHTKYFIENELVHYFAEKCGYDVRKLDSTLDTELERVVELFPYFDNTNLADLRRNIRKKFPKKPLSREYIQRKRDFLNAQWTEDDKSYMLYDKNISDVRRYIGSDYIYPSAGSMPHKKICENCNYAEICMMSYFDKEVDV